VMAENAAGGDGRCGGVSIDITQLRAVHPANTSRLRSRRTGSGTVVNSTTALLVSTRCWADGAVGGSIAVRLLTQSWVIAPSDRSYDGESAGGDHPMTLQFGPLGPLMVWSERARRST
jgi:hypothetical protein